MNAAKSKLMVGSSSKKIIVNSAKWPCRFCEKGVSFQEFFQFLTSITPPLEMKGRIYDSCVRSSMVYESGTRHHVGFKFERADNSMAFHEIQKN